MTSPSLLPLALTMGDPAGCGPQITAAAWHALKDNPASAFYVVGWPGLYCGAPTEVIASPGDAARVFSRALPVLARGDARPVTPGKPDPDTAAGIITSIETATAHALAGIAGAVVTNPIHKALLYGQGFRFPGHTEFIASLCATDGGAAPEPVMMLTGGGLRVALATIHMPYTAVPAALADGRLQRIARITAAALTRQFGIPAPRIAFTGLNPHAGEDGTIGREEVEIINPAAAELRNEGLDISDARPGDTVFAEALGGRFDAVIAMTHDQGLIPVKTLDMWGGVNTTLGLPIIRTSPDHGTAYDAAAAGTAKADSLIAAIHSAREQAANWARSPT
ncbi:4-hydroxythreonine-4-phosphate dehydrogenase [Hyphomonas neptunium ATCC 15444]|uniref:4-hydroxythreonine-4-phosphate dehydrogenase n=1 Tax=Hyphomonas neptunium (strain ATCC 15444) TaxID=228405 RepID=Q0C095_HYPNA|nr:MULTISPECIES: 4-hydroxythreonine-4-phosphate dehydrogenase PdxA [Hyphomonas]ABI77160.1 4-hydroxythreonine-4-phosphate dehydrogenase [Hyphomonas neptunium ATCC 15444]